MKAMFIKNTGVELTNPEALNEVLRPEGEGFRYSFEGHVLFGKIAIWLNACAEIRKYPGDHGYYVSTRAYRASSYNDHSIVVSVDDKAVVNFISMRFTELQTF